LKGAIKAEQEAVVVCAGIVESVLIGDEHAENGGQLEQLVPILAGAGQPAHLRPEDEAQVVQADLGQEPLKADAVSGRAAAVSEVVVDHQDGLWPPPEIVNLAGELVLEVGRLPVFEDLPLGRLAKVAQDAENTLSVLIPQSRPETSQLRLGLVEAGRRRFRVVRGMVDPSVSPPVVAGTSSPASGEQGETVRVHREYRLRHGVCRSVHSVQQVKTMKRLAYGFRDHEFFKLKILAIHETTYALVG
jgi:hypothetical protein